MTGLPRDVAKQIGPYYVYALVDPRDDTIFYVGKGTGKRLLAHGRAADRDDRRGRSGACTERIRAMRADGFEPRVDVVRHRLDEATAFQIEAALIDVLPGLTNAVAGHGAAAGRQAIDALIRSLGARPVPASAPPALLIRLGPWTPSETAMPGGGVRGGHGYFEGMPDRVLIDSLRAWWRVDPGRVSRSGIEHAVAAYEGVTVGVIGIGAWHRRDDGRRGFEDRPAHPRAIRAWLGRAVPPPRSAQNPVSYWTTVGDEAR